MTPPTATVQVVDVHKRLGRTRALSGVSLDLHSGVTGVLGPNGAGKTTLLQLLATITVPTAGQLRLLGFNPSDDEQRTEVRRRLGYLPQEPRFHRGFTVFEFVDYVAILKEHADRQARRREVRRVLEVMGLGAVAGKEIRTLAYGTRKRVALAQVLLGQPRLLLLDEPTAGLDPEHRLHLSDLMARLSLGRTIVLATHQIEHIGALCDHLVVMDAGVVRWTGTPQELSDVARGRVWLAPCRPQGARWSWRTKDGVRHVGDPPDGAEPIEPTVEDGYLILLSEQPHDALP